jgi:succinylglutamate desuccinylase
LTAVAEPETAAASPAVAPASRGRLLGRRIDESSGRWLVVVAGIHGNEPAGVAAVERVFAALDASRERLPGAFIASPATSPGRWQALVDRDLN